MTTPPVFLYLYRQRLPAAAPQSVQILSTAHGLASAGADVYLFPDLPLADPTLGRPGRIRPPPFAPPSLEPLLESYGLSPHSGLHINWLSTRQRTRAGLEYRFRLWQTLRAALARGARPVIFSRRVDYAAHFLRLRKKLGIDAILIHEWHYVPSANAMEQGHRKEAQRAARDELEVLQSADGHVAISKSLADYLARWRPPRGPIRVIPNGAPSSLVQSGIQASPNGAPSSAVPDELRAAYDDNAPPSPSCSTPSSIDRSHPARVIYAGLFRRPDDLEVLGKTAALLPPSIELVIVGGDEEGTRLAQARAQLRATAGAARILFLGAVAPAQVRALLRSADVALATFRDSINMRHFASPLKILEYQAAGIPMIATDHPTVRELVQDGENGLLVAPDDPLELANAIRKLLDDPPLASALARKGREAVRERTWHHRGEVLLEFAGQVVERKQGKVGTILRYYPTYSETFVYREIAEMRAQGVPLFALTMRHRWILALLDQSALGGRLEELPRFPFYLPIIAGALRQVRRAPRASIDAFRWGLRHLRFKDCLKALWMAFHLERSGVTLLHIHFAGEGAEVAEIIRRCTSLPYGITLHARDLFVPRPSVPDLLEHACYLVCISKFNRDWLSAHYPTRIADKARVVHLGVPTARFQATAPPPPGTFPLLTVSRLVEKKGLTHLIRALTHLRRSGLPVTLTIAGEGPLRKSLEALVRRLELTSAVRMPGARTQAEIEAYYHAGVGAFVLPCVVAADGDQDGIPVSLMEAMARSVPVVSTPVSGIPELIDDGVDGLLVPPADPAALAEAIQTLFEDPELRTRLGQAGRQKVEAGFRLDRSVRHLRQLFDEISFLRAPWSRP